MTKVYIINQFKYFGSVFAEPKYAVFVAKTIQENFGDDFEVEWSGWGWIFHCRE